MTFDVAADREHQTGNVILSVADLNMPLPLALAWKRDNTLPLLANFVAEVQRLPDVRAINKD